MHACRSTLEDPTCDTTSVSTGKCTAGCRVMGGLDNCATGKYCTKTDGTLGTCMSEPCNQNSDCPAANPVCNTIDQPHACVECLNDSDCHNNEVCDAVAGMNNGHCVECTSKKTQNCDPAGKGAICLAGETCGCAVDGDCGDAMSGRICDATQQACVAGCRGNGGNACPNGQTCSSSDTSPGTCHNGGTGGSGSSSSGGMGGAGAGGSSTNGAGGGNSVVSQSKGCGCRIAGDDEGGRLGALIGLLLGLGLFAGRARRRHP